MLTRRYRRTGLLAGLILLLSAGGWWWTYVSPYAYQTPPGLAVTYTQDPQRVFVYGTLRSSALRWLLTGDTLAATSAVLPGFSKQGLDLVETPDGHLRGLVFYVDAAGLRRLDRYERLGIRYTRVELLLADGKPAWVYRRL